MYKVDFVGNIFHRRTYLYVQITDLDTIKSNNNLFHTKNHKTSAFHKMSIQ